MLSTLAHGLSQEHSQGEYWGPSHLMVQLGQDPFPQAHSQGLELEANLCFLLDDLLIRASKERKGEEKERDCHFCHIL